MYLPRLSLRIRFDGAWGRLRLPYRPAGRLDCFATFFFLNGFSGSLRLGLRISSAAGMGCSLKGTDLPESDGITFLRSLGTGSVFFRNPTLLPALAGPELLGAVLFSALFSVDFLEPGGTAGTGAARPGGAAGPLLLETGARRLFGAESLRPDFLNGLDGSSLRVKSVCLQSTPQALPS